jgi:beta-N-acetylhexosaminidase
VRRRRLALLGVAAVAAVAGAVVGAGSAPEDEPEAESASVAEAERPECPAALASKRRRLIGQMLVVRMEDEATPQLRRAARRGELGGVVLFPSAGARESALRHEVAALRAAAAERTAPRPLVMIDQEGGEVKRLPGLPPDIAPPSLGAAGPAVARDEGAAAGKALARLGIDVDLAPVVDVPASPEAFIVSRAFSDSPGEVAATTSAFAQGLASAGVAATAKHFPGVGTATVNTDEAPSAIEASRRELAPGLRPFAATPPFDLVMVANATYPAYDPARPASLSPRIVDGLLRKRLGYEGVAITDDLGAGALTGAGIDEAAAAVGAAKAGADRCCSRFPRAMPRGQR